jgi:hypothetical protein
MTTQQPDIGAARQRGIVHFDSQPHRAAIYIDGLILVDPDTEEAVRTPATVALIEGRRDFVLRLEGYHDEAGYVDVFPGSRVNIFRNLTPITPEEKASQESEESKEWFENLQDLENLQNSQNLQDSQRLGSLNITSNPQEAYIYIDRYTLTDSEGNAMKTPVIVSGIPEGIHEIQISLDRYYSEKIFANVIANEISNVHVDLKPIW